MSAQQMSFGTGRSGFIYTPSPTLAASLTYTFSIYALLISGNGSFYMGYYDGISAIAAGPHEAGPFTATTLWQRFGPFTFTTGAADTQNQIVIQNVSSDTGTTTIGTIAFWGAELQTGSVEQVPFPGCQGVTTPPLIATAGENSIVLGGGLAEALPAGGGSGAGGIGAMAGNFGGGAGGDAVSGANFNPALYGGNLLVASNNLTDPVWVVFPSGSIVVTEFSNQFSLQFG